MLTDKKKAPRMSFRFRFGSDSGNLRAFDDKVANNGTTIGFASGLTGTERKTILARLQVQRNLRKGRDLSLLAALITAEFMLGVYAFVPDAQKTLPGWGVALLSALTATATIVGFVAWWLEHNVARQLRRFSSISMLGPMVEMLESEDAHVYSMAARAVTKLLPRVPLEGQYALTETEFAILVRQLETKTPSSESNLLLAILETFTRINYDQARGAAKYLLNCRPLTFSARKVRHAASKYLNTVQPNNG